jgi:hypothetical protein
MSGRFGDEPPAPCLEPAGLPGRFGLASRRSSAITSAITPSIAPSARPGS